MILALYPGPFLWEEEKGPGTHLFAHASTFPYIFSYKLPETRGLLYGRHETAIVTGMLRVNCVVADVRGEITITTLLSLVLCAQPKA